MAYIYTIPFLLDDDTEIEVSGTVKKNPFFTRDRWEEHYAPDEEPHDIEITSELPNSITSSQINEIKELLFEDWIQDCEPIEI